MLTKNKPMVTIGIPAFNEEANIANLLKELKRQNKSSWDLDEVIIYSDMSTDRTNEIVREFKGLPINLIVGTRRLGTSLGQNILTGKARGDILVLLNADILPRGRNFIKNLIDPILKDKSVGLVGAKIIAQDPRGIFEGIIYFSTMLKRQMHKKLEITNPVYLCHGSARALSKEFYQKLVFPKVLADDAYCYFECVRLGFKFIYQDKASVTQRCPATLADQLKQSVRFYQGNEELVSYFGKKRVTKEYTIEEKLLIYTALLGFYKDPIRTALYTNVLVLARILNKFHLYSQKVAWEQVTSSKRLISHTL